MDPNKSTHLQMARSGNGSRGQKIDLLTNHFGVNFTPSKSQHFFQYSVAITYEDGNPVEAKGIGRKILAKVQETYQTDLGSKHFAYDGDKTLFTVGPLPNTKLDFFVVLEDMTCTRSNTSTSDAHTKRLRRPNQSKRFNVAISFAAKISIQAIQGALQGKETNDLQDGVRVLDVILRQNAARKFIWKQKQGNGEAKEVEVTVYDYFTKHLKIPLRYSGDMRCINVGKPKRPTYFPIEQCDLVSLQRYTKALTTFQRSKIVKESVQSPQEKMKVLNNAIKESGYNNDPMLQECGVRIGSDFTQVEGRVLPTPNLKASSGVDLLPARGRWNFNNKQKFAEPATVTRWAVVNFSAKCNPHRIVNDLIRCGKMKGMNIEPPMHDVFEENDQFKSAPGSVRVEKMFAYMESKIKDPPKFLLCILSAKNSDLGGLNSVLASERSQGISSVIGVPTIIIGMDVSHGSPGQSDVPSIAAVVGSRGWPLMSKYRAFVRTQPRKVEMIDNLFNPVSDKDDDGIMSFFTGSSCLTLSRACKFHDEQWDPKFTVIIAQKNHHTKFFQTRGHSNVPPVAPIMYAHLAAAQMATAMKFEDNSESSSSHGGITTSGEVSVPLMPKLKKNVATSMFFC
ncbi:hypothetical protein Bca101_011393 [Brassica carinata]